MKIVIVRADMRPVAAALERIATVLENYGKGPNSTFTSRYSGTGLEGAAVYFDEPDEAEPGDAETAPKGSYR